MKITLLVFLLWGLLMPREGVAENDLGLLTSPHEVLQFLKRSGIGKDGARAVCTVRLTKLPGGGGVMQVIANQSGPSSTSFREVQVETRAKSDSGVNAATLNRFNCDANFADGAFGSFGCPPRDAMAFSQTLAPQMLDGAQSLVLSLVDENGGAYRCETSF